MLVVVEKATNRLVTYTVGIDGRPDGPRVFASAGVTPFGFGFGKRNHLFVSEANGGAPNGSSTSSYSVGADGSLTVISAAVPTTETAACWLAVSNDGRFVYTANAGSASITGYRAEPDGAIALLDADGKTGNTAPGPVDLTLSANGRYLYVLDARSGTISSFQVNADGSLDKLPDTDSAGALNGIAAR